MTRLICKPRLALLMLSLTGSIAFAAPGGNKGKPGGDDGGSNCAPDAVFPALIYPVDSAANDGTRDLVLASSDGCTQLTVEQAIQFGGARLMYDQALGTGYYAWSENLFPGNPPGTIRRQYFSVTAGALTATSADDIFEGVGYLSSFDLRGDLLTLVDQRSGEQALLVIDLADCVLPCNQNDAVPVYTPSAPSVVCLEDDSIIGCFRPEPGLALTLDGAAIYFDVQGEDSSGNRVYGVGRVRAGTGWAPQTPELFVREDNYPEVRVYGPSGNAEYLTVGYLAGFNNDGLRDDRVIIVNTDGGGEANLSQDFAAWTATWTVDDTLYLLGTEGKRRKLKHPIEEFDPATGLRESIGISLDDHPGIDSSL